MKEYSVKKTIIIFILIINVFLSLFLITNNNFAFSENIEKYKLTSIKIIPTSIVAGSENNFVFEYENEQCIKIESFVVSFNGKNYELTSKPVFAPKHKKTELLISGVNFFEVSGKYFDFDFKHTIKTGFSYRKEPASMNNAPVIFSVNEKINDNCHTFCFNNINASSKGFSYNLEVTFCK